MILTYLEILIICTVISLALSDRAFIVHDEYGCVLYFHNARVFCAFCIIYTDVFAYSSDGSFEIFLKN